MFLARLDNRPGNSHRRAPQGGHLISRPASHDHEVDAVGVAAARQEWIHIAPSVATDFALIRSRLAGFEFSIQSQTDDNRRWIVMAHKAEQPATYYLLDRDQQSLTELFRARPALAPYRLAPMHAVQGKSRDGLDLVSYLTLPADIQGDRPPQPLPMVLVVHGGPWARDIYGYRGDHQWLADRGYAVLSVNYRGSTGFGKAFVAAGEKQHAAKMHDDLIDMVEWAINGGIAQRDKSRDLRRVLRRSCLVHRRHIHAGYPSPMWFIRMKATVSTSHRTGCPTSPSLRRSSRATSAALASRLTGISRAPATRFVPERTYFCRLAQRSPTAQPKRVPLQLRSWKRH
jgi:hypothetical protein